MTPLPRRSVLLGLGVLFFSAGAGRVLAAEVIPKDFRFVDRDATVSLQVRWKGVVVSRPLSPRNKAFYAHTVGDLAFFGRGGRTPPLASFQFALVLRPTPAQGQRSSVLTAGDFAEEYRAFLTTALERSHSAAAPIVGPVVAKDLGGRRWFIHHVPAGSTAGVLTYTTLVDETWMLRAELYAIAGNWWPHDDSAKYLPVFEDALSTIQIERARVP